MKKIFNGVFNYIKKNKILSSIIGILITIIISMFFLLVDKGWDRAYYKNKIGLEVSQDTNIIMIIDRTINLSIKYLGVDFFKNDEVIRVMHLKLHNQGNTIEEGSYSSEEEFGFQLLNAKILDIEIVNPSSIKLEKFLSTDLMNSVDQIRSMTSINQYYTSHDANIENLRNGVVNLNKIIFDRNAYLSFKIIYISDKNKEVTVTPIASISEIEVNDIKVKKIDNEKIAIIILVLFAILFIIFLAGYIIYFIKNLFNKRKIEFLSNQNILLFYKLTSHILGADESRSEIESIREEILSRFGKSDEAYNLRNLLEQLQKIKQQQLETIISIYTSKSIDDIMNLKTALNKKPSKDLIMSEISNE